MRPGITGFTQAYYRNSISQDLKLKYDAEYANNVSFIKDLKYFLKQLKPFCDEKIYIKIKKKWSFTNMVFEDEIKKRLNGKRLLLLGGGLWKDVIQK